MCESEACELISTVIAVVAVYIQGLMQSSPINPAGGLLVLFFGRYVLLVSGTPHETPSELCVSFGANCIYTQRYSTGYCARSVCALGLCLV